MKRIRASGELRDELLSLSGTGISHFFRAKLLCLKLMWAVSWLAGASFTGYLIVQNISDFFSYDVITKSRINIETPMRLPGVTVCNLDPFVTNYSISFLADLIRNQSGPSNKSDLDLVNYSILNNHFFQDKALYAAYTSNNRTLLGYDLNTFFINFAFDDQDYNIPEIDLIYDIQYGNCFTINSNSAQPLVSTKAGKIYGLQLELFVGKPDYYETYMESTGVRVFIYDQDCVYSDSNGFDVAVGTETNIALTKTTSQQIKFPFSNCTIDANTDSMSSKYYQIFVQNNLTYLMSDCLELCYQMVLLERCDCIDSMSQFNNLFAVSFARFCDFTNGSSDDSLCFDDSIDWFCRKPAQCPIECNRVSYTFSSSFSKYPTRSYERSNALANLFDLYGDKLKENILKVNIYFNDLSVNTISETAKVKVVDLLSNLGGVLGGFIGFSVLTFLEFVDLFVKFITKLFKIQTKKIVQI